MSKFSIMDVTCRDGSYAINFQLSLASEKKICQGLESLGYEYVEIGHGMGLGASRLPRYTALHTDEEYLKCAYDNLKTIKYGMFCIPGIATLDDIKLAAEYGCQFIRIGSNVEDVNKTESYIKEAKKLGLMVASNYMKSYASTVEEFGEAVKKSTAWGTDLIYIVDSSGGMMPSDIKKYFDVIKKESCVKTGFHGHNNIGMALANSIYSVELGIDFIDCSLQGLGRSSGNTPLEHFSICMEKIDKEFSVDISKLLLLSKKHVYPFIKKAGLNPVDTICGMAGFHSSYLPDIYRVAAMYEVNPLTLIIEYSKIDQVNMNTEKLESIAANLPKDQDSFFCVDLLNYIGGEQ